MTALTRLLLLQPLIVASNSVLDLNFTSMYQIGALEVCLTCTWLIIRTQRELKNAPLVGGFWAAVASVWYLKYFSKSYIYFSQFVISSVFVPTVLPRPLETDGRLRMLSISISTNYFSSSPSFLHTNIPVSFLLNISSRPSWDKLGYEWWRIEWQLRQEDTRFREKFGTDCT